MTKYKRSSATIDAFQWLGYDPKINPKWFTDAQRIKADALGAVRIINNDIVKILTIDGILTGYKKDYIIRTPGGEIYPCNAAVFQLLHSETAED